MASTLTPDGTPAVRHQSQTLWHVARGAACATALLTHTVEDHYRLDVTFGTVARQRLRFATALAAAEHADRLLVRLAAAGYQPQRRDRENARDQHGQPMAVQEDQR